MKYVKENINEINTINNDNKNEKKDELFDYIKNKIFDNKIREEYEKKEIKELTKFLTKEHSNFFEMKKDREKVKEFTHKMEFLLCLHKDDFHLKIENNIVIFNIKNYVIP